MNIRLLFVLLLLLLVVGGLELARRRPAVRRLASMGGDQLGAIAPRLFALIAFGAGAILLVSSALPAPVERVRFVHEIVPLPLVELSAYFAAMAGIGLVLLARGLQRRLDAAYHLTVWLLAAGIVFSLGRALDVEQAVVLSVLLVFLIPSQRFFYRKASILEERFTIGWVVAIGVVVIGTVVVAIVVYGSEGLGTDVLWRFAHRAQGPRAQRSLVFAGFALIAFGFARLMRPARISPPSPTSDDIAAAERIVAESPRASAQLAFLGDKSFLFNEPRTAFVMYGVVGQSWVSLGDPIGPHEAVVQLIDDFVRRADRNGGWPVFYRASPALLHLYLDYALSVVKLGEVARVPLAGFSLEGPKRRNLRRVWRKAIDEGCTFEIVALPDVPGLLPTLRLVSDQWLAMKNVREKGFSLGRFDEAFIRRGTVGIVRQSGEPIAFVTLWHSGQHAEVEVDLMRYVPAAPSGIMRYALIEAMSWAQREGYAAFSLGMAPLSGIRTSPVMPAWHQLSLAVREVGERYYNFKGLRDFKEWFYPEWEPRYLVSPGGTKRPVILANVSSLISSGMRGVFTR